MNTKEQINDLIKQISELEGINESNKTEFIALARKIQTLVKTGYSKCPHCGKDLI